MPKSRYANVKRNSKDKKKDADQSWTAPAMWSDDRYKIVKSAFDAVDEVARQMQHKWGIGKLERLASPQLAISFNRARVNFSDAANGDDENYMAQKAANLIAGWKALEQYAKKNGFNPTQGAVMYLIAPADAGGGSYAIIGHSCDSKAVTEPVERVYTADEVIRIIQRWENTNLGDMTSKVKEYFPDAEISKLDSTENKDATPDDLIPF